jgi:hypothetical protein
MNKQVAKNLKEFAKEVAERYSKQDRENNFNKETFELSKVVPMGEHTAAVLYTKNTGKCAVFFFYLIKDKWRYFVPTDSHILGMMSFNNYKLRVEEHNMKFN